MTITWIGQDWGYPPIKIASDETDIRVVEYDPSGPATYYMTVTVPSGLYWCLHALSGWTSPKHTPLFRKIESLFNSNSPSGLTYTISAAKTTDVGDASSTTSDRKIGVKYDNNDSNIESYFEFSSSKHTFPPELLGWPRGHSTDADNAVVKNGSPRSNFGRWTPTVRRQNDGAAEKPPPRVIRRQASSDDDPKRAYTLQVDETRKKRVITYQAVGATAIQRHRADLTGYPALDKVVSGEENNALNDHLAEADGFQEWLWVHDNDDRELYPERANGTECWEYAALEGADDSDNLIKQTGISPEQFEVEVEYEIRQSEYDQ